jgi:hypothetical protein
LYPNLKKNLSPLLYSLQKYTTLRNCKYASEKKYCCCGIEYSGKKAVNPAPFNALHTGVIIIIISLMSQLLGHRLA